jgi:glycosyltransferase involved in cell wall biosynthesis
MLKKQLEVVKDYPEDFRVIVVDDCSPEPAEPLVFGLDRVWLYRIDDDIPWNREGARNLGATVAGTEWIIQVDTDHILPVRCAEKLANAYLDDKVWYRFPRYRVGKADDTRKKDSIPEDQECGRIKPHIDSYLCTAKLYWEVGGYNEEYSGCLGGGGPFLKRMAQVGGEAELLPEDTFLEVYTRDKIKDASVWDLSRDKTEFKRRKKIFGSKKAKDCLRFKWHRVQ